MCQTAGYDLTMLRASNNKPNLHNSFALRILLSLSQRQSFNLSLIIILWQKSRTTGAFNSTKCFSNLSIHKFPSSWCWYCPPSACLRTIKLTVIFMLIFKCYLCNWFFSNLVQRFGMYTHAWDISRSCVVFNSSWSLFL
jgi:hypothetical protein